MAETIGHPIFAVHSHVLDVCRRLIELTPFCPYIPTFDGQPVLSLSKHLPQ